MKRLVLLTQGVPRQSGAESKSRQQNKGNTRHKKEAQRFLLLPLKRESTGNKETMQASVISG